MKREKRLCEGKKQLFFLFSPVLLLFKCVYFTLHIVVECQSRNSVATSFRTNGIHKVAIKPFCNGKSAFIVVKCHMWQYFMLRKPFFLASIPY